MTSRQNGAMSMGKGMGSEKEPCLSMMGCTMMPLQYQVGLPAQLLYACVKIAKLELTSGGL